MKWAGRLDMYRKIPADLMEGTKRGSVLSLVAAIIMGMLFLLETMAYFSRKNITQLQLDTNEEVRVRLNFNITMMDLKCDFAVVDVVSVLGTEQNVTSHVTKWNVDAAGVRQRYQGRNKQQKDIDLFDSAITQSLEELHEDGEDAIPLNEETFEYALKGQEYLFVDFFASWCSHCIQLAPTWESLAEVMTDVAEDILEPHKHQYSEEELSHAKKVKLPVMIAKVDCVQHHDFCRKNMIMAYPTLRLFVDGQRWPGGDYRGHRTVVAMTDYLAQIEDMHKTETGSEKAKTVETAHQLAKDRIEGDREPGTDESEEGKWAEQVRRHRQRLHHSYADEDHPGCQLSGHLLLDRVPGNFHIQARSPHHDIVPHLTNVSHVIHSLSIGEPVVKKLLTKGLSNGSIRAPKEVEEKISPMDGNVYVSHELHEAYHHYLKVITTNIDGLKMGRRNLKAYQIIQSSQLSYYRSDIVPEAKFILDLSPIAVNYKSESRHWYDYITSIMAIIGGAFTVVGLVESTISQATAPRRRYK